MSMLLDCFLDLSGRQLKRTRWAATSWIVISLNHRVDGGALEWRCVQT